MQFKIKTTINDCDRRNFVFTNSSLFENWNRTPNKPTKDEYHTAKYERSSLFKYVKANRARIDSLIRQYLM
jgi:hypothetical protein